MTEQYVVSEKDLNDLLCYDTVHQWIKKVRSRPAPQSDALAELEKYNEDKLAESLVEMNQTSGQKWAFWRGCFVTHNLIKQEIARLRAQQESKAGEGVSER